MGLCAANPITLRALDLGHPEELLGAALCAGAVLAAVRGRATLAGVLLGLAVANKAWALLAVGPVLLALQADRRRALALAGAIAATFMLPLLLTGAESSHPGAAAETGVIFQPWQVWWFLGSAGEVIRGGDGLVKEGYRSAPGWVSPISHPLIVAVALPLSLLAWRRRSDPLLLLALLFLLRCVLDPWNTAYYALPAIIAVIAWEATRSERPPVFALSLTVLVWATWEWIVPAVSADAEALVYLGWSLPLVARPAAGAERLEHHAVALREADERGEVLLAGVRVEVEAQPDRAEAHGRLAVDAERAAEVEVALGQDATAPHVDADRGRDGAQGHARAGGERLEQHVAGAELRAVAAGGGVKAGLGDRTTRVDRAADAVAEVSGGLEGDERGVGVVAVALLEGSLEFTERGGVHGGRVGRFRVARGGARTGAG